MSPRRLPGKHRQRGAAALEFALLAIPLLTMLTAVVEFGRVLYSYQTLVQSVRGAARLLSRTNPVDATYASLKGQASCLIVYGSTDCSGQPLLPGLQPAMVRICDALACPATHSHAVAGSTTVNLVTVSIGSDANPFSIAAMSSFLPALVGLQSFALAPVSVTLRQEG